MSKKIKYFLMSAILPPLIALFLALLKMSLRIEHVNRSRIEDSWDKGVNFIYCFWHGRLLLMPFSKPTGGGKVLVSYPIDFRGELEAPLASSGSAAPSAQGSGP